jgi:hypothetical protein
VVVHIERDELKDMEIEMKNSMILKNSLQALCKIAGRRTSETFAYKVMNAITASLKERYDFLHYVDLKDGTGFESIQVSSNVDTLDAGRIYQAIETVIRVVHMDLQDNAGLYFLKEFKESVGPEIVMLLEQNGVDLSLLEVEQQHVYIQRQKKKNVAGDASLLGYTWNNVSTWKYDDHNKVCILYGSDETILDKLNLDVIIKEHIDNLTGSSDLEEVEDIETERYKKEYDLLKLLHEKDMDIETAMSLLKVSEGDLDHMIHRLLNLGLLEYVDFDVVTLSKKGVEYISK